MPAKSLYSYSDTLYAVLDEFKPARIFEWGPGTSTQIMALHSSVKSVTSVEHEEIFYDMVERLRLPNVMLQCLPNFDEYVGALGLENYDLIFVDGRDRSRCLLAAKGHAPVILLHDAARSEYRDSVNQYSYKIWSDEGNTVLLTDDFDVAGRAVMALGIQVCDEPKPEVIQFLDKTSSVAP